MWARLGGVIGDRFAAELSENTGSIWDSGTQLDQLQLLDRLDREGTQAEKREQEWTGVVDSQLRDLVDLAVDAGFVYYIFTLTTFLHHIVPPRKNFFTTLSYVSFGGNLVLF